MTSNITGVAYNLVMIFIIVLQDHSNTMLIYVRENRRDNMI